MGIDEKKERKGSRLTKAAYELFITKGIEKTTIDEIVKKAGVAKGTFYLYFSDKKDLLKELILKHTTKVLEDALVYAEEHKEPETEEIEKLILVVDYLIDFMENQREFLTIVYKNLSMGLFHYKKIEKHPIIFKALCTFSENLGISLKEAERKLYMVIELVGAICYNSIVLGLPCSVEELKPDLLKAIRGIVQC